MLGFGRSGAVDLSDDAASLPTARLDDAGSVARLVRAVEPTQVYYVAAHHRSSEQRGDGAGPADIAPDLLANLVVNQQGPIHFLDALLRHAPNSRFFFASSSLIFGRRTAAERQDESTAPTPVCQYGVAKLATQLACRRYREEAGFFASVGILYNHESELRGPGFLTRRIVDAALRIRAGSEEKLVLGSLDAMADWGYAGDFVDAFRRILDLESPGEFIVATGVAHTVRHYVQAAFDCLGLDWSRHVVVDPSRLQREISTRIGNADKLTRQTGWKPSISFEEMVRRIVDRLASMKQERQP